MIKNVICTQNTMPMDETLESLGCILNRENFVYLRFD